MPTTIPVFVKKWTASTGFSGRHAPDSLVAMDRITQLIGLEFVQWRLRNDETGGAELDVIMEGANLIFSRWQIQCKNSSQATLEDIAKEIGLAQVIRTNVIMIVTSGRIGDKALAFAE